MDRGYAYCQLMRLDKPIGILLLLWPTLWALAIVFNGHWQWRVTAIFIAGVVVMRSLGCVINDMVDHKIDQHVERTRERPLASGRIYLFEAFIILLLLSCIALGLLLCLPERVWWWGVAGFGLACFYPFSKRWIVLPQAVLGVTFAWAIPMVFVTVKGHVSVIVWLLYAANWFWIMAYDTQYAMVDREDDLKIGVRSSAIFFGGYDRLAIVVCQCLFLVLMSFCGTLLQLGGVFYISVVCAAMIFFYQCRLTMKKDRKKCFKAFLNNHWVGWILFLGIVLSYCSFMFSI